MTPPVRAMTLGGDWHAPAALSPALGHALVAALLVALSRAGVAPAADGSDRGEPGGHRFVLPPAQSLRPWRCRMRIHRIAAAGAGDLAAAGGLA